jgi:hypothetical protein
LTFAFLGLLLQATAILDPEQMVVKILQKKISDMKKMKVPLEKIEDIHFQGGLQPHFASKDGEFVVKSQLTEAVKNAEKMNHVIRDMQNEEDDFVSAVLDKLLKAAKSKAEELLNQAREMLKLLEGSDGEAKLAVSTILRQFGDTKEVVVEDQEPAAGQAGSGKTCGSKDITKHECGICQKVFPTGSKLQRHAETCKPFKCSGSHDHDGVNVHFNSFEEANNHFLAAGYDAEFRKDSGFVRNYKHYVCNRTGTYVAKKTTKKNVPCSAHLSITSSDNGARLSGCIAHDHENEAFAKRIPQHKKDHIVSLLQLEIPKKVILEKYCNLDDDDEGDKPILLEDIRRLEYMYIKPEKMRSDLQNLEEALKLPSVRAWNLDGVFSPNQFSPEVQNKYVESTEMVIISISELERANFRKNPGNVICDGTHNSNKNNYTLTCSHVLNRRQEGRVIFHTISPQENTEAYYQSFKVLKELEPEAWKKVHTLQSDMVHYPKLAYKRLEDEEVRWIACSWHFDQAMGRNISDPQEMADITKMKLERSKQELEMLLARHKKNYGESSYFQKHYGKIGKIARPENWSRAYTIGTITHTMHAESYHCHTKKDLSRYSAIAEELYFFVAAEKKILQRDKNIQKNIRNVKKSDAMVNFNQLHTSVEDYTVEAQDMGFKVTSNKTNSKNTVLPNNLHPCIGPECLVMCSQCPQTTAPCAHKYTCSCEHYTLMGICKHQHLMAQAGSTLTEAEVPMEGVEQERGEREKPPQEEQ